jgi:hypothetical protein
VPGCSPPETFTQQAGTPVNGWQWDEARSIGTLLLREVQCPVAALNCRGLKFKFRLRRILDGTGNLANGSGALVITTRLTQEDAVVSAPGMGTDLTFIDFPGPLPFQVVNGNSVMGASVFVQGPTGTPALPG